ncbi:MAG: NRDE family protein [Thermoguttaceae bacterium]|jgi:hypothetical protein
MCVLAIQYKVARDSPLLIAANREELYDRPTQYPRIYAGQPRLMCGVDKKAGGTWLGVNQFGLFAAVANRAKIVVPPEPRSRGLLCRDLLNLETAVKAANYCVKELHTGKYAGANFVIADAMNAWVVYGGDTVERIEISPGLHLIGGSRLDDLSDERQEFIRRLLTLQRLDSAVAFLAVASRAFSRRSDSQGRRGVVIHNGEYGTVSSTLLSLPKKTHQSIYHYSAGPPSENGYEDLSAMVRQLLAAEK